MTDALTSLARETKASYRQLSHWVSCGYLATVDAHPGAGHRREMTNEQLRTARLMCELVHVGFRPAVAAKVARQMAAASPAVVSLGRLRLYAPEATLQVSAEPASGRVQSGGTS